MQVQNEKDNEGFRFTYSAKEQDELRKIRQKYQPEEESKMDKLRRLDESVTKKATMVSLVTGIIGALVMGTGMSLVMTEFGENIGLVGNVSMAAGIIIGMIGMVQVSLAYPLYNHILKREKEKIAPEILRLTEELMR